MTLHARVRTQLGTLGLDCDLSVGAGVTVAVLGPNGAGKTTLLRVIAGLVPVDEGRVECDGAVFEDTTSGTWLTPEARRVGFVFQDHGLFPHISVLDNVAFGLRARGVDRKTANAKAHEWLERVELATYATSRPSVLSGGQSQRAALAAVSGGLDDVAMMRAAFDRRRRTMLRMLNEIDGVACLEPEGAFYAFPSVRGLLDSPAHCIFLASSRDVA